MRQVLTFKAMLFTLALMAACVTVNVYFPAAAVQEAADRQIDYITGRSSADPAAPANKGPQEQSPPTSRLAPSTDFAPETRLLAATVGRLLELAIPAAHAQANIDVSSPEVRAITESMRARFEQLRKYFDAGVVGLTNDGRIEVRDANAVPLAERATVTRLVSEDNRDRAALYSEIAKANGHPEWEAEIRKTYAARWVARAQSGWYYQDEKGNWVKK